MIDEERLAKPMGHVVNLISVDDLLTLFITELSNAAAAIAGASRLVK